MTTPTTDPVPSNSPLDLLFNAEKLDEVINSGAQTYTDRLGVQRKTAAGAVASIAALTARGAWATATAYTVKDLVEEDDEWYVCIVSHTSGATFAGDLAAYWRVHQGVTREELADRSSVGNGPALIAFNGALPYNSGSDDWVGGLLYTCFGRTAKEITAGVTPTNYAYAVGDVRRYGAIGDGTQCNAAVQAAVDVACVAGGVVFFASPGRYALTTQIDVQSKFPVHIVGDMSGQIYNPAENPPGILVGGTIAGSLFRFESPTGTRGEHGGGSVRGLNFYDPTGSGSTRGTRTITAAIDGHDFALSSIERCTFHWLNGSAITGEFLVMTDIKSNIIRYCGASSKPAINIPSTSTSYPAQSMGIVFNRVEVCHDAAYIAIGANASDIKLIGNGFETDTAVSSANQQFLTLAGNAHSVTANHFNRTTTTQVTISAQNTAVCANTFRGGAYNTTSLVVSGNRNTITGNNFQSSRTKYEVDITGPYNNFSANTLYLSGAVRVGSIGNNASNNIFNFCTATTAELGAGDDWWLSEAAGASSTIFSNNTFSNNGGSVTTTGGMRIRGTVPSACGNNFNAFNGSGNGAICIRVEVSNATVGGNSEANSTTLVSTSGIGGSVLFGNNPASGGAIPLTVATTVNPADLADGAGETIATVTVTGAALGDFVAASFSLDLQGITMTPYVSSANTVSVRFQNETGGAINLASGTLRVKVVRG